MNEKEEKVMPEISEELKAQMKAERLNQYKVRMFGIQMDIEAYQAVGDTSPRITQAKKNLNDLVISYYAVEGM